MSFQILSKVITDRRQFKCNLSVIFFFFFSILDLVQVVILVQEDYRMSLREKIFCTQNTG
ncbi:unnamed protein product, partial [Vitis vinifera]|uniref:Uncharacterized protein n=1 Tax=Vitis vinifera TaxID=29760 RepID=E0CRB6_VITVI